MALSKRWFTPLAPTALRLYEKISVAEQTTINIDCCSEIFRKRPDENSIKLVFFLALTVLRHLQRAIN